MGKLIEADTPVGIRCGEQVRVYLHLDHAISIFAVMVADVPSLPLPFVQDSQISDGPVESAAVIGAMWNGSAWQWMHMAESLKEVLGRAIFDNAHVYSRRAWYSFEFAKAEGGA